MFGSLVQKLQSLSPLTSPTTSPSTSPKVKRKFGFGKTSRRRKDSSWWKEEAREVQSEPELDYDVPRKDRRKISAPVVISRPQRIVDEPYPDHTHLDTIYDVPARIRKPVGRAPSRRKLQVSKTVGRVEGIRKADRLTEYDQYFASLLVDTHPDHPDYSEICRNHEKVEQLLNRRDEDGGELARIQELFPNDNLKLHNQVPISQKMKGLIRKRSTTAAKLQRAFSAKGTRVQEANNNRDNSCANSSYDPYRSYDAPKTQRQFLMETPVQFTTGVQSQERHLFLFTDLLLVAKARSGGNFKLKEKVRISEMWLANCLDDVAEISKNTHTSFVMGWPTTNIVASFSCMATKDLWYNKLSQVVADQRDREPQSTTIQVTYYDPKAKADICKTVNIGSTTTTRECIALMLDHLELGTRDPSRYQLWIKTPDEESPYPLIGHEFPFAIKYNCIRDNVPPECESNQCNGQLCDESFRCKFILRLKHETYSPMQSQKKVSKKAKKSPIKIHNVFKRSNSKGDVTDGAISPSGALFGQHLAHICHNDGSLPTVVMSMLHQLFQKGPFTVGIFRKSANARLVRELKEKMDTGQEIPEIDSIHITAIAALFKDLLRSLPDCLLNCNLYEEWLKIPHLTSPQERISHTLFLCSKLPSINLALLQHFLCVLHHISRRCSENMMPASNLAVCVGPSLLWPSSPILALSPEASKQAPATVEFLIERCSNIFGRDVLSLMGEAPETDPLRQDSGAEESDSLHSGQSLHSSGGLRRDDSSIDSLERELMVEGESVLLPRKDKMSLTNLSRDSGLTMSDSQLYTPDEEESGSTSSSNSGDKRYSQPGVQHYTAPNNPNAIYTAVYRRPDRANIGYGEPHGYYAAPHRKHAKVHVTYSNPNFNYSSQEQSKYPPSEVIYSVPNTTTVPVCSDSNFQRDDWTRRKSNIRRVTKANHTENTMVRSNSEESLFNKYNIHEYGVSLGAGGTSMSHDDASLSGKMYSNPKEILSIDDRNSPLRRSKSAHQITDPSEEPNISTESSVSFHSPVTRDNGRWHRSQSTPHIHDEIDHSYDSSTLSDEDSTPHVSRSNSRGKEFANDGLHPWNESYEDSQNSSFKSSSICTVISAGSTNTLSSSLPSYEEALSRRTMMLKPHQNDFAIREEKVKSARAKQLYEESLRIYQEENTYPFDLVRASPAHTHDGDECDKPPPLPPKADPPPLPPKQKTHHRKSGEANCRLRHLPPVHIDDNPKNSRNLSQTSSGIFGNEPIHKTIIYTDDPPNLPPKERTVIEIDQSYSLYSARRQLPTCSQSPYSQPEKKSIETQTDEFDLDDDHRDESIQTSGSWTTEQHVTSVPVPDASSRNHRRKSRPRRKESLRETSPRSHSMPGRNWTSDSDSELDDCEVFTNVPKSSKVIDPDFEQEISWSVSRLRAIFGDALNGAKVHPPPYRPPPEAHRQSQSSYRINDNVKSRPKSSYAEESYV